MYVRMLFIAALFMVSTYSKANISYTVSFPRASEHYAHVNMTVPVDAETDFIDFTIPVWTPGSYKVREFSQNVEQFKAHSNGALKVDRLDKATWRVYTKGHDHVQIDYDVYCFVVSVRQSYIDNNYAFIHGVSVFGYIEGMKDAPVEVSFALGDLYKDVHVAMHPVEDKVNTYACKDYDQLVDSPMALGDFETVDYLSGEVPHKVVMMGEGNYDLEKIGQDFKKICDEEVAMFGTHPIKDENFEWTPHYIHFIQNVNSGGGGLEHANCQTSQVQRWAYENKEKYKNFLGLVAHEYFHLWNVKRIRPIELGPFDYTSEVYTDLLWVAEGITSYFDDLFLYRAGFHSKEEYLTVVAGQINRYENTIGKSVMDVTESSKLAWIKAYLPNENSSNTSISYYNKGMIVAVLLDLEIMRHSKGKMKLDDVMRELYKQYRKGLASGKDHGFTEAEFIQSCSDVAGTDLRAFFEKMVHTKDPINYKEAFGHFGLSLENDYADRNQAWSGISSKMNDSKVLVTGIASGSPAAKAGLSVNDELISNNNWRLDQLMEEDEKNFAVGDTVEMIYNRDGKIFVCRLILERNPEVKYQLKIQAEDNRLLKTWLQRA